ncbi:hypothetical protein SS50377_26504 [Spironucleus salmonicida]|uniref:Uncharacterized protein n=1 Tax=Spironucleus salmonicida TaxID=348837 RepID=A0A9P8LPV4_9EUKA|nr:hypothetical protein SS50377_26504 [Spironucleus salmonicida]
MGTSQSRSSIQYKQKNINQKPIGSVSSSLNLNIKDFSQLAEDSILTASFSMTTVFNFPIEFSSEQDAVYIDIELSYLLSTF